MCLDESDPRCSVTVTVQYKNKELKEQQLRYDEAPSQEEGRKKNLGGIPVFMRHHQSNYPSLDIPHASTVPARIKSRKVSFSKEQKAKHKKPPIHVMHKDVGRYKVLGIRYELELGARYYSQFRAWAASSASRARSSWLLASARAFRFCFFCALSCDWSLPPFEEAFARACPKTKKKSQSNKIWENKGGLVCFSSSYLGRLGSFSSRIARIARVVGRSTTSTTNVAASTAECSWRTADFRGNA